MSAPRLPGIRKPEADETPLSESEQWIAIRESHFLAVWIEAQPRHWHDPDQTGLAVEAADPWSSQWP